jgi:hypothetical protein
LTGGAHVGSDVSLAVKLELPRHHGKLKHDSNNNTTIPPHLKTLNDTLTSIYTPYI